LSTKSKSCSESEYCAMSLLIEFGFPQTVPVPLHEDNTNVIQIATHLISTMVPAYWSELSLYLSSCRYYLGHLSFTCFQIPQLCKWLICLPILSLDNFISFLFTNWCFLINQHEFEGGCYHIKLIYKTEMFSTRPS